MKLTWRSMLPCGVLSIAPLIATCSTNLTDTVYSGTWERGRGTFSRSVIEIWNERGEYRFRVNRYQEEFHKLRCPLEGACTIYEGDAPVFELVFEAEFDEAEDALFIDCTGTPLDGVSTPVHWIERISVSADGEELLVQRVALNGLPRTDGPRRFQKISSDPF